MEEDKSRVERFLRQVVIDDINTVGVGGVIAMVEDLRSSGFLAKADLVEMILRDEVPDDLVANEDSAI